jgi:hypothetical protein
MSNENHSNVVWTMCRNMPLVMSFSWKSLEWQIKRIQSSALLLLLLLLSHFPYAFFRRRIFFFLLIDPLHIL